MSAWPCPCGKNAKGRNCTCGRKFTACAHVIVARAEKAWPVPIRESQRPDHGTGCGRLRSDNPSKLMHLDHRAGDGH